MSPAKDPLGSFTGPGYVGTTGMPAIRVDKEECQQYAPKSFLYLNLKPKGLQCTYYSCYGLLCVEVLYAEQKGKHGGHEDESTHHSGRG